VEQIKTRRHQSIEHYVGADPDVSDVPGTVLHLAADWLLPVHPARAGRKRAHRWRQPDPVGVVNELIRGDVYFWGTLMAGALLGSVPVAIVYSFFVDNYVSGLTAGAVKG